MARTRWTPIVQLADYITIVHLFLMTGLAATIVLVGLYAIGIWSRQPYFLLLTGGAMIPGLVLMISFWAVFLRPGVGRLLIGLIALEFTVTAVFLVFKSCNPWLSPATFFVPALAWIAVYAASEAVMTRVNAPRPANTT